MMTIVFNSELVKRSNGRRGGKKDNTVKMKKVKRKVISESMRGVPIVLYIWSKKRGVFVKSVDNLKVLYINFLYERKHRSTIHINESLSVK